MSTTPNPQILIDKVLDLLRQAELLPGDAGAVLPRQVGALSMLAELLPDNALTPQGIEQAASQLDQIEAWLDKQLVEQLANIDIGAVLESRRQIAHIWSIDDVAEVRPDLTDEQAWEVLQHAERRLDSDMGISWDTLSICAEDLYPEPDESGQTASE